MQITVAFFSSPSCSMVFNHRTTPVSSSMEKLQRLSSASRSRRLILESSLHPFFFPFCSLARLLGREYVVCLRSSNKKQTSPSPEARSPVQNTKGCPGDPQALHTAASPPLTQEQKSYGVRTEHGQRRSNESRRMPCPVVKLGRTIFN